MSSSAHKVVPLASDAADDPPELPNDVAELDGAAPPAEPAIQKKTLRIATVSHTLDSSVAERLRHFAFRERVSESAVIEFALREFFNHGDDASLGERLRRSGAALRRKT